MDVLTKEQRRRNMQAIKNKNTKIELLLGKALWAKGYRYRKNNKKIFGKPDFTLRKYKVAIFCDGDFFHGKDWETAKERIKTNREFWHKKIESNIQRDKLVTKTLEELGWTVIRFWGSDIKKHLEDCLLQIDRIIMRKAGITYSNLKSRLNLDVRRLDSGEGLAFLTHYLQNKDNGVKQYFEEEATEYLSEAGLAEDNEFQYQLPITYDIPFPPPANPKFKFIDLFAGIGGFRLAFQSLGGKCVFTSEWNKFSKKTYEANFGEVPFGDITKIDANLIPDHDILLAGFPCQPFSIAGVSKKKSLGREHGFKDETQGTLFFDIVRILETKRPKAFLLENVKNLVSHDKGKTFKVIKGALKELGYSIHHQVLDGKHFVPQHRERIFIAGFDKNVYAEEEVFSFPELPDPNHIVEEILEKEVDPKYTLSDKLWKYLQDYAKKHKEKGNGFGFGLVNFEGITRTISARYYKDGSEILVPQEKGSNPRRLTPRECARLQGYPESFVIPVSDTQAYRQFGNSVVMPLVKAIGQEVTKVILDESNRTKRN
jgi:DNA (cytosine-5)-methyltransferase 1